MVLIRSSLSHDNSSNFRSSVFPFFYRCKRLCWFLKTYPSLPLSLSLVRFNLLYFSTFFCKRYIVITHFLWMFSNSFSTCWVILLQIKYSYPLNGFFLLLTVCRCTFLQVKVIHLILSIPLVKNRQYYLFDF